jgi:RNA recognition motif-containing protein
VAFRKFVIGIFSTVAPLAIFSLDRDYSNCLRRTSFMGKRLYVGNLSYSLKSQELEQVFKQVGEVISVKIINDQETGQSKGFAFVEMGTDDLGAAAIEKLNGHELGGRALRVTEANPRPERPAGAGGNRFGGQREGGFSRGARSEGNREGGFRGGDRNGSGNRGGNSW